MKVGTKSVLFGVHCALWHPISVALAWRKYYHRWPSGMVEWVAILLHDVGYWGMPNMDGPEGQEHPWVSAQIAAQFFDKKREVNRVIGLIVGHSRHFAKTHGLPISDLYAPDKICVLYDPMWFYLLRANLSGEIAEFMQNGPAEVRHSQRAWFKWYRNKIRTEFYGDKSKVQKR